MNILSRILVGLLIACPLLRAGEEVQSYASQKADAPVETESGEVTRYTIAPLSQENIDTFKSEIEEAEDTRKITRVAVIGALGIGASVYLYKWFYPSTTPPDVQTLSAQVTALATEYVDLKRQIQNTPAPQAGPPAGWFFRGASWAWDGVKGLGSFAYNSAPNVVKSLLYYQLSRIAFGLFPSSLNLADYLFQSRTTIWCLEKKTQFIQNLGMLLSWCESVMSQSPIVQQQYIQEFLGVSLQALVKDVEKVIGYMEFIKSELKDGEMIKRAELCIKMLRAPMDYVVAEANTLLTQQQPNFMAFTSVLKEVLLTIVDRMKEFEPVHQAAGYKDVGKQEVFNYLRVQIFPERYLPAPPAEEDGEGLNMLHQLMANNF